MFNWLGNLFPYSDLHSLNLDWILSKMKEIAEQAAKAIADAANALAQVIEAKTAAQNAQTAASNAQTAASNAQTAANNAATSAENAVGVAQTAQTAANAAQTAAQNATNTATAAQTAAQNAQETATDAKTVADASTVSVNNLTKRFPVKNADIARNAVSSDKLATMVIPFNEIINASPAQVSATRTLVNLGSFSNGYTNTGIAIVAITPYSNEDRNTFQAMYSQFRNIVFTSTYSEYVPFTILNKTTGVEYDYIAHLEMNYSGSHSVTIYKRNNFEAQESLPCELSISVKKYVVKTH